MTSLYIGGSLVDADTRTLVAFTWQQEDLSNPTIVKNSYSNSITLPGTRRNNRLFGAFWRLDRLTGQGYDPLRRVPFQLIGEDGALVESGYCKLDGVTHEGAKVSYRVSLFGGLGGFLYGLMYTGEGDKKSLASLDYLMGGDAELDFNINAANVQAAWQRLGHGDGYSIWDVVNFAPMYNGLPPGEFDAGKAFIPVGSANCSSHVGYSGRDGYALVTFPGNFTEWEVRDLRSYLQRPVVSFAAIMRAIAKPANNGGYTFDWSAVEGLADLWMTLPMLGFSGTFKQSGGALQLTWDATTFEGSGGTDISIDTATQGVGTKQTFNMKASLRFTAAGAASESLHLWRPGLTQAFFVQLLAYDASDNLVGGSSVHYVAGAFGQNDDPVEIARLAGYTPTWNAEGVEYVAQLSDAVPASRSIYKLSNDVPLTLEAYNADHLRVEVVPVRVPWFSWEFPRQAAPFAYDGTAVYPLTGLYFADGGNSSYTYEGAKTVQSGALISKALLLGGTASPAEYLVAFCKLFGLYLHYDAVEKKVTVLTRAGYYNGGRLDIDGMIDRDKALDIVPNSVAERWLDFQLEEVGSSFGKLYETLTGRVYGSHRVDTGSEFNADRKDVLSGSPFKAAPASLAYGRYFYIVNDKATSVSSGTIVPPPFMDSGNKYTLWNSSGKANSYDLDTPGSASVFTPLPENEFLDVTGSGYDGWFRMQMHDSERKCITDGSGVLLFLEGFNSVPMEVTDDEAGMFVVNGKPCWKPYLGTSRGLSVPSFLSLKFLRSWGAVVSDSLDLGLPRQLDMPNLRYDAGVTLYAKRWGAFLADRYDRDAKVVTAWVRWERVQVNGELLRRFYWFDGSLWFLNKISEYNPAEGGPVKCEFVRIMDADNYTVQE